jgi:hypothetical protein
MHLRLIKCWPSTVMAPPILKMETKMGGLKKKEKKKKRKKK